MANIPLPDVQLPRERRYRVGTLPDFGYLSIIVAAIGFGVFAPDWHYRGHIALLAILGVLFIAIVRGRTLLSLYNRQCEALTLAYSGELARALEEFDRLAAAYKRLHNNYWHAIAIYNCGFTRLCMGQPDQALSHFTAALATRAFEPRKSFVHPFLPIVLAGIGRCYAVKGHLDEAEKWHDLAHEMLSAEREGTLFLLQTLTNVRRGNFAVAVNDAEKRWPAAEGNLSVRDLKMMRVLCVFASERMNKLDAAESWMAGVKPFIPGEFDYVVGAWPDFRDFLARRGLSRAPAVINKLEIANARR